MAKLNTHDLEFILKQIKVAEAHSNAISGIADENAIELIGDELRNLVDSPLLPTGLRTVDGSYNNLVPGREKWGASGEPFPQLTQPNWVNENDDLIVFGAGSPGQITFTDGNYGEHCAPFGPGGLGGGTLVDADPRIISNLVVDQTLDNPAAIAAALRRAGHSETYIASALQNIVAARQVLKAAEEAAANIDPAEVADLQVAIDAAAAALTQAQDDAAATAALAAADEIAYQASLDAVNQTQAARADAANAYLALLLDSTDNASQVVEIAAAWDAYLLAEADYQSALADSQALGSAADASAAAAAAAVQAVTEATADLADAEAALANAQVALTDLTAAQDAMAAVLEAHGVEMDGNTVLIPNAAPDEGLSAPYNAWFTLFGQFFDHGLDLVAKGGNGTVYIPLQPDDPLYVPGSHSNFMALTRATIGEDAGNVTTPWVDQNQTYTSHASHQVFLREYAIGPDGKPMATGLLLEGRDALGNKLPHTLATWKDIKDQAREMLGIELTDADVGMVPLLRTDPYGNFIPDPVTGYAQVIIGIGTDGVPNTADDIVISGTPANPVGLANAVRIPNAFLDDIAHTAVPVMGVGADGIAGTADDVLLADSDDAIGYSGGFNSRGQQTSYDNEMLDAHYITGDGRGNENIGLTAVHFVFHAEHNRQISEIKQTVLETGDLAFLNEWLLVDLAVLPATEAEIAALTWDGERLFQAGRFATEMQYQHLVFEEFARKIQPDIDVFIVQPDVELNPAIFAEFANVVYRFGHSMLNQTVDRQFSDGQHDNIDLFQAFLNPIAFGETGVSQQDMAGAIALGMSRQHANEIDEFITDVLRNQLVGIPLDLAALNIARGRDTGMPTLNQARAQFQEMAGGDTLLKPYDSWVDFALNLSTPESIINFIAAYGRHTSITSETTVEGKREAAMELVLGVDMDGDGQIAADRLDFLNGTGAWAGVETGLNEIDLWIGGLAEKTMAFGGMLGSTFSFIFQLQMENLQDSDRFYYLSRTQGLNFLTELENNSLAKMVLKNTNLGELGIALPADIFSVPDHTLYMDLNKQLLFTGLADPTHDNPVLQMISSLVERRDADGDGVAEYIRYNGLDHIIIQGTDGNDHIVSGGGDDTVWGGDGDDRIEAGYGVDSINGGKGNDIITSAGTDIGAVTVMKGEEGNDVIIDGTGMSLIFGGDGGDYLVSGADDGEIRGGEGNDTIIGGDGAGILFGNEGDDWIEGGGGFDYIAGDNGELFFNSTVIGHDVLNGGQGDTDYDADSGDDIMFAGEGIQKNIGMWGHDWVIHQGQQTGADADMRVDIFTTLPQEVLRDRFSQVEGLSGWHHDDVLRGDDREVTSENNGTVLDPTPETDFRYNELDEAGIARIAGLDQIITPDLMRMGEYWADGSWENGATGTTKSIFVGGNILLGGGGSDIIEGRGGDDVIDGDRFLSVSLKGVTKDGITFTAESANAAVTLGGITKPLSIWMLEGRIDPGTIEIVRELKDGNQAGDEDVAIYWDVFANYEITRNDDGSFTVAHINQTGGAVDPVTGANRMSDGVDRLYNIEVLRFADGDVNLLRPTLDLNTATTSSYAQNFGTANYAASEAGNWASSWVESGDVTTGNTTTGGQIRIQGGALVFGDNDNDPGNGGASIQRTVDLAGASSATLSFDFDENSFDNGEIVTVSFAADGTNFTTLQIINGASGEGSSSFNLTGPFAANAVLRFEVSGTNNNSSNDTVTIDNLRIDFTVPVDDGSNDFAITFTEGAGSATGTPAPIASSPIITDLNGQIVSAKVVLTNAKAGDALNIPTSPPGGITRTIDTSVPGIITVTLLGATASLANWQSAIQSVSFVNSSQNPDTENRVIEVTVSNGEHESAVATTTVTVVPTDDPVNAGDDDIITNIAQGTPIIIPEWVLLRNDIDPDSVLDITAVSGQTSLTAVLNDGSITVVDTGGADGDFDYTVTGGSTTDLATVDVDTVTPTTTTFSENFSSTSYTQNDGSWTDDWVEFQDDNSNTGANGQIRINGNRLEFDGGNNTGNSNGAYIQRGLSGLENAASATISFSYGENIDSGETVTVQFSRDGVNFQTVHTITSTSGNGSVNNLALTGPFTANAFIRFTVSTMNTDNDVAWIDNLTITATTPATTINGGSGSEILIGDDSGTTFDAGTGNDIILAGGGDDIIVWNANTGTTDGRDYVDGGSEATSAGDRFVVNGNNTAETFIIYARIDAVLAGYADIRPETEIVITRNGVIIAELVDIEEITINTGPGTDTVVPVGDFEPTSLNYNTITIEGSEDDDTIDITSLHSAHRIVFKSNGGNDVIIGELRDQDVIELPEGANPEDYETVHNADGSTTIRSETHSVTFFGTGAPDLIRSDEIVDEVDEDDDLPTLPVDEDEDDEVAGEEANAAPPVVGTSGADTLLGSALNDYLIGFAGDDVLLGFAGNDVLLGGDGSDLLVGDAGNDTVFADAGDDTVIAGEGDDMVYGGAGNDRLFLDGGNDFVNAGSGDDLVVGGAGNDWFVAEAGDGNDTYFGDDISGGTGNDTLDMSAITVSAVVDLGIGLNGVGSAISSATGTDTLHGIENVITGSGNDTIIASNAVNVMDGGAGADTFVFKSVAAANGDTILGFETGDKIDLSGIDADTGIAGNQAFSLTTSGIAAVRDLNISFESRADGEYTVIEGNTGGGTAPEFKISIKGTHDLTANDFVL